MCDLLSFRLMFSYVCACFEECLFLHLKVIALNILFFYVSEKSVCPALNAAAG